MTNPVMTASKSALVRRSAIVRSQSDRAGTVNRPDSALLGRSCTERPGGGSGSAESTGQKMHGYAIAERIEQLSERVLQVGEGSLYPALHCMDEAGWIRSEWAPSDNNRRARHYRITAAGRRQLANEHAEWQRAAAAITRVLRLA